MLYVEAERKHVGKAFLYLFLDIPIHNLSRQWQLNQIEEYMCYLFELAHMYS